MINNRNGQWTFIFIHPKIIGQEGLKNRKGFFLSYFIKMNFQPFDFF